MSQVCNKQQAQLVDNGSQGTSEVWATRYRENERFIESGSAYFAQAFAEAMNLVADIELHELDRAQLRLAAIRTLLDHAREQYSRSIHFDAETGLSDYHESVLRELGLDLEGTARVVRRARDQGFVIADSDSIRVFASVFQEHGYRALTEHYLGKVIAIQDLVSAYVQARQSERLSSEAWQDLGWKLTSSFAEAMDFGQCMAVLNATAYR